MKTLDLFEEVVLITEEELYEMARVSPKDSGLKCVLFASTKTYVSDRHGPRIKVSNIPGTFSANDNFVVSVSHEPSILAGKPKFKSSELEDIFDWVRINYEPLIKYWNAQYESDVDFYLELSKI